MTRIESVPTCRHPVLPSKKVVSSELVSEVICRVGRAVALDPLGRLPFVTAADEFLSATAARGVVVCCSAMESPFEVVLAVVVGLLGPRVAGMTVCEVLGTSSRLLYDEFVVPVTAPLLQLLAEVRHCLQTPSSAATFPASAIRWYRRHILNAAYLHV